MASFSVNTADRIEAPTFLHGLIGAANHKLDYTRAKYFVQGTSLPRGEKNLTMVMYKANFIEVP